jgi:hypothetical protein
LYQRCHGHCWLKQIKNGVWRKKILVWLLGSYGGRFMKFYYTYKTSKDKISQASKHLTTRRPNYKISRDKTYQIQNVPASKRPNLQNVLTTKHAKHPKLQNIPNPNYKISQIQNAQATKCHKLQNIPSHKTSETKLLQWQLPLITDPEFSKINEFDNDAVYQLWIFILVSSVVHFLSIVVAISSSTMPAKENQIT